MYGWDLHFHRRFLLVPSPLFLLIFSRSLASRREGLLASRYVYSNLCTVTPSAQTKSVRVSLSDKQFRHVILYGKTSRLHWTKRLEILTAWTARWRNVCFRTTWYCVPWQRQRAKFLSHLQVPVHVASSKIIHDNSQGKMVPPILWKYIKCTFLFLGYIYSDFSSLAGRAQYFTLFSLCSVAYHHNLHVRYAIAEICNNKPWTGLWIFQ